MIAEPDLTKEEEEEGSSEDTTTVSSDSASQTDKEELLSKSQKLKKLFGAKNFYVKRKQIRE